MACRDTCARRPHPINTRRKKEPALAAVKSQLKSDLVAAMKAHDDMAKSAIRMAISAISAEEVAGDSARELTDDQEQAIITKQVNVRKDSALSLIHI